MKNMKHYTLRVAGRLFSLHQPQVMGILNATPDSFYGQSRMLQENDADSIRIMRERVRQIIEEGGSMIDVGAYSTRPGAPDVTPEEEMRRLSIALRACREEAPEVPVSVDTFRADVARFAIEEGGAHIINDISGGELDRNIFRTVSRLKVPYILMHMQGTPQNMQQNPRYKDVTRDVITYLASRAQILHEMGVSDIIADPGFGFGKTVEHNYQMMRQLACFHELSMPLLVGISRKSMIYKPLDTNAEGALYGTITLNAWAALHGAHILRVHDVKAAADTLKITQLLS